MNDAKREDDGPYEQAPEQEEVAGFFDGMAQGRALMLRRLRTALAPLGLTVNRRATLVAISDAEPIPETVGKPADNPFQNPHYDFGYRCGLVAANQVFAPAARELLSHLAMSMADDGTVSLSAKTPSLAAAFLSQKRELVAPPSINTPAADRILTLFANREARAAFTKRSSTPSRRALLIGACASVLLALGSTLLTFRSHQGPALSEPTAQVATLRPSEVWDIFDQSERPIYELIDQWIVDRYNLGAHGDVASAILALANSTGNSEVKIIAAVYVCRSERWELARLLLPVLDPTRSSMYARFNALIALRRALKNSGSAHVAGGERTFLAAYAASSVETSAPCQAQITRIFELMNQLGI